MLRLSRSFGVERTLVPAGWYRHASPTIGSMQSSPLESVLVVGAGAAGLTASYDLMRAGGYNVTILEANSILGGRLRKLEGFADFPIDLGGEWIHNVGPSILSELVNDDSVPLNIETVVYDPNPIRIWDGNDFYNERYQWNDWKFVNYTWFDFFHDYIASNDIVFDCVVETIDYSTSNVSATCEDGRVFYANKILVTVPVKILQEELITFNPPLPNFKQVALTQVIMPPAMKLFMKFQQDFYPDAFAAEEEYTNEEVSGERLFYDETWGQDTSDHVLGMFMIGGPANRFVGMSSNEVVATVLDELDIVFDGQATLHFEDAFYQDWEKEEFIRGSYSIYIDYNYVSVMKRLEQPLMDRLFFAGEHLPPDYFNHGYAHGAALSGRKQANLIMGKSIGDSKRMSRWALATLVGAALMSLL